MEPAAIRAIAARVGGCSQNGIFHSNYCYHCSQYRSWCIPERQRDASMPYQLDHIDPTKDGDDRRRHAKMISWQRGQAQSAAAAAMVPRPGVNARVLPGKGHPSHLYGSRPSSAMAPTWGSTMISIHRFADRSTLVDGNVRRGDFSPVSLRPPASTSSRSIAIVLFRHRSRPDLREWGITTVIISGTTTEKLLSRYCA
jgi:ureidoacrylate peracid hydrolase